MPLFTLTSDLGYRDTTLAVAKGILLRHVPDAVIADICNDITHFNIREAAYMMGAACRAYPEGTIHISLVDIFSMPKPQLIFSEHGGQFYLMPNNATLPLVIADRPLTAIMCRELPQTAGFADWMDAVGRVCAGIVKGALPDAAPGRVSVITEPQIMREGKTDTEVECQAVYVDGYGNVVIGLKNDEFEQLRRGRPFKIKIRRTDEINAISNSYREVAEGALLCRINSHGYLEICINNGRATDLLGLKVSQTKNNRILITFYDHTNSKNDFLF